MYNIQKNEHREDGFSKSPLSYQNYNSHPNQVVYFIVNVILASYSIEKQNTLKNTSGGKFPHAH